MSYAASEVLFPSIFLSDERHGVWLRQLSLWLNSSFLHFRGAHEFCRTLWQLMSRVHMAFTSGCEFRRWSFTLHHILWNFFDGWLITSLLFLLGLDLCRICPSRSLVKPCGVCAWGLWWLWLTKGSSLSTLYLGLFSHSVEWHSSASSYWRYRALSHMWTGCMT